MSDTDLLEEIRERYTYATSEWSDIRAEGKKDMQYIGGDPWDPADRKARKAANRPCLSTDELGQYVNQGVNDLRQNKRGIKVSPVGNGANDKTAQYRQGRIRDIEYRSNAQQAYMTLAENAFQRSYGYLRIRTKYVSETSGFDQEQVVEPILNPDLVTPDPDCLRTDGTGWKYLFFEEARTVREFVKEYPKATKKSFAGADIATAPGWYNGNKLTLAEYWARDCAKKRKLLLLKPAGRTAQHPNPQPIEIFEDEINGTKPSSDQILKHRWVEEYAVTQYLTNGFEILDKVEWSGQSIPFVSCYGKTIFVDDGSGTKRKILSLIRLARDPQMLMAFLVTCEAELVGMTPKTPYMAYEGQFSPGQLEEIKKSLHEPVAVLFAKAMTSATGSQLLPLPQRQPYEPALQALEILKESVRRSIQAAIGVMFLPTSAQRQNEKSGVALDKIKDSAQKGSYHFVDHFEEAVTRTGVLLDEGISSYDDTAKDVSIRNAQDDVEMVRINDPEAVDKDGQPAHIEINKAHRHDVTISVGPWKESEREAGSDFADTIVGSKVVELVGPEKGPRLIGAAIRMKNLGPLGDAMADIIDPKDPQSDPAQAKQEVGHLKQMLERMHGQMQQMADELKTKKLEQDTKKQITAAELASQEKLQITLQRMKDATTILLKKLDLLANGIVAEHEAELEALALAHEAEQAEHDRAHEVGMAAMGHDQATDAAAQGAEQDAAAADQSHQQNLEAGDIGHQQALEQGQQAADLAPRPEAGA